MMRGNNDSYSSSDEEEILRRERSTYTKFFSD